MSLIYFWNAATKILTWCFWTVVLEKTLESPLDYKEIKPVHPKGNQSWIFIGRTDAEAETPILWAPDEKSWLIWKDPDAGKDWGQKGEGNHRGWDGWMAPPTRWTRVWVDSRSWWWTGRPGGLRFMGSQRVRHDWVTELNILDLHCGLCSSSISFSWKLVRSAESLVPAKPAELKSRSSGKM